MAVLPAPRPLVPPVEDDARGIIAPAVGLTRFRLDRFAPSPPVARFVDRYWLASWDLEDPPAFTQRVLAHPVVNVVMSDGAATIVGVTTSVSERTLEGTGRALGAMFRPAGFRPFLKRALSTITDRSLPAGEVLGAGVDRLADAVADPGVAAGDLVARYDHLLAAAVPAPRQPSEDTSALVERLAADPSVARVEALAAGAGLSVRQLQRRFADHVGMNPKAVIRRYRLYEAGERARRSNAVDWAALAGELGYSDQSHLVRDFRTAFGDPPDRYASLSAPRS
jgi:AraC-like DNA-binding protein